MFRTSEPVQGQIREAESNYVIRENDYLHIKVFTNKGERIIDPDFILSDGKTGNASQAEISYLVDREGVARFPMIGAINIKGLTARQAEDVLQKEYAQFYKDAFVVLTILSKRVVVLGASGGQVIPLTHENIRLTEVLALSKGLDKNAKAHNIRVLRDEQVFVADLSTVEGYRQSNMIIQPGDIVYIEPVRRSFLEGLRDYGSIISIVSSVATLIVVISNSN